MVQYGKKKGADEIEVSVVDSKDYEVNTRHEDIENLTQANSRFAAVKVIKGQKTAHVTSSDLSSSTLQTLVKNAVQRALFSQPDPCSGLPSLSRKKVNISSLQLFDPSLARLDSQKKISLALNTEKIALSDPRITNSHGASFETREITSALANSNGFSQQYSETFSSLSLGLQAGEVDNKVEGGHSSTQRFFHNLETPEELAKKAVHKTVRQLNSYKITTQNVPVVFEPRMTSWLLGFLFNCVSGISVYRRASFLLDKLNQKIGGDNLFVYDDGLLPGKLGTEPFDSEGVPTQKTPVLEKGILKNYLTNTYAGKKLHLPSTGNAMGNHVGPHNFYLLPGKTPPHQITASLDPGFILTRTMGHGLNPITGDISRGAQGLWVEKGEVVYPVSEVTIYGNLGEILKDIDTIGNDLDFWNIFAGPSIKIKNLTVAGKEN
ncbi:TldD/PmbA family protein [bacterium]|nr:TldD/PmbA family protein [bacterium]